MKNIAANIFHEYYILAYPRLCMFTVYIRIILENHFGNYSSIIEL